MVGLGGYVCYFRCCAVFLIPFLILLSVISIVNNKYGTVVNSLLIDIRLLRLHILLPSYIFVNCNNHAESRTSGHSHLFAKGIQPDTMLASQIGKSPFAATVRFANC